MYKALQYPFDPQMILKKRRSIKKELLPGQITLLIRKLRFWAALPRMI